MDRRRWLQHALAGSTLATAPVLGRSAAANDSAPQDEPRSSAIARENEQPGTRAWMLDRPRIDPATRYRCPWIEGYCSHASVRAGETVRFYVSTDPSARFDLEIFRMGYYGGDGGRLMHRWSALDGHTQPDPPVGPKRVRSCQWDVSAELTIPAEWTSGVYLGKLTSAAEGIQSYLIFIVRDDRAAPLMFQCSDHTWQAYNRWPNQFSLYDDGNETWYWGPDVKVSFNRPYGKYCQILDQPLSTGSGEFFLWEYPFVYWLEHEGYDVTYVSNQDTHHDADGLRRVNGLLSVGHDEYWTPRMFNNVRQAIVDGLNVGFFSGNAVCGKVAWDPEVRGFERIGVFGPPEGTVEFKSMSRLAHERPYGNELMGAHSTGPVTGGADWICTDPNHWIYAQTGMALGDSIPGLIGWEWHGDPAAIPGLEIVATGPTQSAPGRLNGGQYTATVYPGARGNLVFNAATCWWADSLSEPPGYVRPRVYTAPQGPDARAQQITRNVLARLSLSQRSA